jgi:Tfp pilus assembly protein FimT
MRHLVVLNLLNKEGGFSLFELIIVFVIMGIVSAIGAPSLINSQRQERVNEAFGKIQGALVEAQINANRQSTDCTVKFAILGGNSYQVSGNPSGCVLEPFKIDKTIVNVTQGNFTSTPTDIKFSYSGTTFNAKTLWIARKNFSNIAMPETAKCIVISSIGMIRTGIFSGTTSAPVCDNLENKRYDIANP